MHQFAELQYVFNPSQSTAKLALGYKSEGSGLLGTGARGDAAAKSGAKDNDGRRAYELAARRGAIPNAVKTVSGQSAGIVFCKRWIFCSSSLSGLSSGRPFSALVASVQKMLARRGSLMCLRSYNCA